MPAGTAAERAPGPSAAWPGVLCAEASAQLVESHPAGLDHGADPSDGGEPGVAPEVVGGPGHHLAEQVDLDAPVDGGCRQECVADLVVVSAAELALREVGFDQPRFADRSGRADPAFCHGPGGEMQKDPPGKVLLLGWRGRMSSRASKMSVPASNASSKRSAASWAS